MKLYWYKVTDNFYSLDDFENVFEMRREEFQEDEKNNICGNGDLLICFKNRADEYYKELGLEYIGFEVMENYEEL